MTTPDGATAGQAPSSKPRRRLAWPRLHRSTWVAMAVALAALGYIAGTGELLDHEARLPGSIAAYEHGWPWTFAYRFYWNDNGVTPPVSEEFAAFDGGRLAADVAAVLVLALAVAAVWEWRRRRGSGAWQFSLRESLLVVTLVAVALSWWQWHRGIAREEARLDEVWQQRRGDLPPVPLQFTAWRRTEPLFLRRLLPRRWLRDFVHVAACEAIRPDRVGDADDKFSEQVAECWSKLPYCTMLEAKFDNVPPIEAAIAQLPHLHGLAVEDLAVRRSMLGACASNRSLRVLDIENLEGMPDGGLSAIGALDRLESLGLCGTPIGDDDLIHLCGLKRLKRLRLDNTYVCGRGLARLASLDNLRSLSLARDHLDADGVESLASLTQIEELDLRDTSFPAEMVPCLMGMKNLRSLLLSPAALLPGGERQPGQEGSAAWNRRRIALSTTTHPIHRAGATPFEEIETELYGEQRRFDLIRHLRECYEQDCPCHARLPSWVRTLLWQYDPHRACSPPSVNLAVVGMGLWTISLGGAER